eukprot:3656649-Prymnesium_polylepis.1
MWAAVMFSSAFKATKQSRTVQPISEACSSLSWIAPARAEYDASEYEPSNTVRTITMLEVIPAFGRVGEP